MLNNFTPPLLHVINQWNDLPYLFSVFHPGTLSSVRRHCCKLACRTLQTARGQSL